MSNTPSPAPIIEHIVVLMLENRSYDNILGYLYDSKNLSPYNSAPAGQSGLDGLTSRNSPDSANQITPTIDGNTGNIYPPTAIPIYDPGELFADMAQQYIGSPLLPKKNPYTYSPTLPKMNMQGFTTNYAKLSGLGQKTPPSSNVKDVMNYFTPDQLPVTSYLANKYAVCDSWYASAPTQTFTNRAFSICAGPGVAPHLSGKHFSLIDDWQYIPEDLDPETLLTDFPSLFSILDQVEPGEVAPYWKVYFHDYSISQLTVPYVASAAQKLNNINVAQFDTTDWPSSQPDWLGAKPTTFLDDITGANGGALPAFSLIEPRYSNNYLTPPYLDKPELPTNFATSGLSPNSNHPGSAAYLGNPKNYYPGSPGSLEEPVINPDGDDNSIIDVADGEALLANVYSLLRNSEYWDKTLFIVTYDEPGGLYDHVSPKPATSPGTLNWPSGSNSTIASIPQVGDVDAADGFDFNVFGGRVPTIVCSPYITPSTTISSTKENSPYFDHTSIISTAWNVFELGRVIPSLNERDAAAPDLMNSIVWSSTLN